MRNPEIVKLQHTHMFFGATPSQFLLNGVVKMHAGKYKKIDPDFTRFLSRYMFVDDLNCGVTSTEEGIELYRKVKWRFLEGNFNFRKWRTNDKALRNFINSEENIKPVVEKNVSNAILGISWNEYDDSFIVNLNSFVKDVEDLAPTKRNVLKVTAGVYDPWVSHNR